MWRLEVGFRFFAAATTAGLCIAASALCLRAERASDGQALVSGYLATLSARYTVRSDGGWLVLYGPPTAAEATLAGGTARTRTDPAPGRGRSAYADLIPECTSSPAVLAAAIRNEDVVWQVFHEPRLSPWSKRGTYMHFSPRGRAGSPICELAPFGPESFDDSDHNTPPVVFPEGRLPPYTLAQVGRFLLAALEDERRWVAAHVVLDHVGRTDGRPGAPMPYPRNRGSFNRADGSDNGFALSVYGLNAQLTSRGPETPWQCCYRRRGSVQDCVARIDPAQRARLLDQWHRRLDVKVVSVRPWQLLAATALFPGAYVAFGLLRSSRRAIRRRRGRCAECGYDLRYTAGCCPECGATPARVRKNERAGGSG